MRVGFLAVAYGNGLLPNRFQGCLPNGLLGFFRERWVWVVGESGERLRSDKRYATDLRRILFRRILFRSDSSPLDVMMMPRMTVMIVMTVMTMLTMMIVAMVILRVLCCAHGCEGLRLWLRARAYAPRCASPDAISAGSGVAGPDTPDLPARVSGAVGGRSTPDPRVGP